MCKHPKSIFDSLLFLYYKSKTCKCFLTQYHLFYQVVVVLPLLGFIQQLLLFKKQRNTGSFSIFITAVMIHSSILKIFFYFMAPYKTALFSQNFLMIILHVLITKEYVDINQSKITVKSGFNNHFWQWKTFKDYIIHLLGFTVGLAIITFGGIQLQLSIIGQIFGLLATVCEISLAFPQIIKCYKQKSAKGISRKMIAIWNCSALFKTIYFIQNAQPFQFIATGAAQICTSVTLAVQMWLYRQRSQKEVKNK